MLQTPLVLGSALSGHMAMATLRMSPAIHSAIARYSSIAPTHATGRTSRSSKGATGLTVPTSTQVTLPARPDLHTLLEAPYSVNLVRFPPKKINTVFNVCPQGHEAVVEFLGKYSRTVSPGWFFSIPFVETIRLVDLRELTIPIDPQTTITKDNVSVRTGGALYVKVTDSYTACYGAVNPLLATVTHAKSAMRVAVGGVDLDTLFHNRQDLNDAILRDLTNTEDNWGLTVRRYELTDVLPDQRVSEAMDVQSVAERERRKTILDAEAVRRRFELESEGERQAQINNAQGHKQKVVLTAEAEKLKQQLEAEGKALAIERIAEALQGPMGKEAMSYALAQQYLASLSQGISKGSTVFLPHDMSDVPKLIATGMEIVKNINGHQPK